VIISVWATPGARASEITGTADERLRVRLAAPPVEGRANAELRRFLAQRLGVPPSAVIIVAGSASRRKRVAVVGVGVGEAAERLGGL
jgi:hypothetical protein